MGQPRLAGPAPGPQPAAVAAGPPAVCVIGGGGGVVVVVGGGVLVVVEGVAAACGLGVGGQGIQRAPILQGGRPGQPPAFFPALDLPPPHRRLFYYFFCNLFIFQPPFGIPPFGVRLCCPAALWAAERQRCTSSGTLFCALFSLQEVILAQFSAVPAKPPKAPRREPKETKSYLSAQRKQLVGIVFGRCAHDFNMPRSADPCAAAAEVTPAFNACRIFPNVFFSDMIHRGNIRVFLSVHTH